MSQLGVKTGTRVCDGLGVDESMQNRAADLLSGVPWSRSHRVIRV